MSRCCVMLDRISRTLRQTAGRSAILIWPERGCAVSTSRSMSAQHQAVLRIRVLRLMLRTQPRSAK